VMPGERLTYTLTVTNEGDAPTLNLVLTDALPLGTALASATTPYYFQEQTVAWTLPSLAVGERLSVTLVATVGQAPSGTFVINDRYGAHSARITSATLGAPVFTRVVWSRRYYLPMIFRAILLKR
jgi:uncharacterized repeat protein (TIGR01451 family)